MRITVKQLEYKVDVVNALLGFDDPQWNTVGAIRLYRAYGATGVHQVMNSSGGVTDLIGLAPMKEIARFLDGMIVALRITREVAA